MKKEIRNKIIVGVLVIAFIVSAWAYNEKYGEQIYAPPLPTPSGPSCNVNFSTDATEYALGEVVSFTLTNTTDGNCTSEEEYPWMIWKLVGEEWEPCYSPLWVETPFILYPTEFKTWTWNQVTTGGDAVTEGEYMIWIYYNFLSGYVGEMYTPLSLSYEYGCITFFTISTSLPATTTPAPTTPAPEEGGTPPPRIIPPSTSSGSLPSAPSSGFEILIATVADTLSDHIIEVVLISILIAILIILAIKEIALIYILITLIPLFYMLYRIFLEKKICIINLIILPYILFLLYKERKKKKGGKR